MRSKGLSLFVFMLPVCIGFLCKAQTPVATQVIDSLTVNYNNCNDCSSTFLLNSFKEKVTGKL
jgi:hypothetical protein